MPPDLARGIINPSRPHQNQPILAQPTSYDLPTLMPRKAARKPSHSINTQGIVKKRVFKKRNRKITSCTNCRSRKLGCNKGQPCSHCKSKDLQCAYIENPSDLDKAPTRVVKKRNRRVKVCLHCRDRKIPCSRGTPSCRACLNAGLNCAYQPLPEADVAQHGGEQTSTLSVTDDNDPQEGLDGGTNLASRKPSPMFDLGGQYEEAAAYGRHGKQSDVNEYSAMERYGYPTSQIQPQHRHQYPQGPYDRLPEPAYHSQGHTAYGYPSEEPQARHPDRNDQGKGHVSDRIGANANRGQTYSPMMDPSFYAQRQMPYDYRPLAPSRRAPVYPQHILNPDQSLYPPRQFFYDPSLQYHEPPSSTTNLHDAYEQPKPDNNLLDSTTKVCPPPLDDFNAGVINGPPLPPRTAPLYPRLGAEIKFQPDRSIVLD